MSAVIKEGPYHKLQSESVSYNEADIEPGMLVEVNGSNVVKHAEDADSTNHVAPKVMIADAGGEGSDPTVAFGDGDTFNSGDQAEIIIPAAGSVFRVQIDGGEDVTGGDYLVSSGNGLVRQSAAGTGSETADAVIAEVAPGESFDDSTSGVIAAIPHV